MESMNSSSTSDAGAAEHLCRRCGASMTADTGSTNTTSSELNRSRERRKMGVRDWISTIVVVIAFVSMMCLGVRSFIARYRNPDLNAAQVKAAQEVTLEQEHQRAARAHDIARDEIIEGVIGIELSHRCRFGEYDVIRVMMQDQEHHIFLRIIHLEHGWGIDRFGIIVADQRRIVLHNAADHVEKVDLYVDQDHAAKVVVWREELMNRNEYDFKCCCGSIAF